MSQTDFKFKREQADIGIEQQEANENYIENAAIIDFLIQYEPRKDIDLSKIAFPSYLFMNEEDSEN